MYIAIRHIVPVGKRSLAVVLPKTWVSMLGIGPGDSVMLRLNDDGSITISPTGPRILIPGEALAEPRHGIYGADKRLIAKEKLMALALGSPEAPRGGDVYRDPDLLRVLASLYRGEVLDHEVLVNLMIRYLEDACRYLADYIASLDSNIARKIHEVEGKMDLLYYLSYRASAVKLLKNIQRELGVSKTIKMLLGVSLLKISEDLVDSFDRIAWRIEEAGEAPRGFSQLVNEIYSTLLTITHCINNSGSCGEDEMGKRYEDIQELRRILKEEMRRSEKPSQVYAEIASILNNLEGFVEISLMTTLITMASQLQNRSFKQ